MARPGKPSSAAASERRPPCREAIHSEKTELGTETVRAGEPGRSTKETSRVGSNQVLSSLASSLFSRRARIVFQRSFIETPAFPHDFHRRRKSHSPEAGSISPRTARRRARIY